MRQTSRAAHSNKPARLLLLLIAVLVALVALVPTGQAAEGTEAGAESQPSAEVNAATRAADAATRAAIKEAERETIRMQREAARNARREARRNARAPIRQAKKERENVVVSIDCSTVTLSYRNFPDAPGNVVTENLKIRGTSFPSITDSFDGPSATITIPIVGPVGHYLVDIHSKWHTNGVSGDFDIPGNVTCLPTPAFTLQKLQAIAGSGTGPTTATLPGMVGQTVDYTIQATNTGNTPLTFSRLEDPRCDPGTIAGGNGEAPVEPLTTVTYTCTHKLTAADEAAGSYTNLARITGTPEEGEGPAEAHESNLVVVTPITPFKEETKTTPTSPTGPTTNNNTTPKSGVLSSTSSSPPPSPKSGVLAFSSATVPTLKGPQGCVRGAFTATIRSAGVASVTFYIDGHKLGTRTSKSSRKGLLSIRIDPSRLKVGAHHVIARITMKKTSTTAKAAHATRSLTVVRCHVAVVTPKFTG